MVVILGDCREKGFYCDVTKLKRHRTIKLKNYLIIIYIFSFLLLMTPPDYIVM